MFCSSAPGVLYLWILDSSNGPGGKNQLLPGLLQVDDVDAIGLLLEDVLLHRGLAVVRPDVDGGSQHLGDVILLKMFVMRNCLNMWKLRGRENIF